MKISSDKEYDVIVVGAGPAGGSCARELSKKGWKVLLLEKSKEIGEPNFSSAGTQDYILKEFDLPKTIIGDYWDKLQLVTPSNSFVWKYSYKRGYVLKFNELKKFLVKDAIANGCNLVKGVCVEKILSGRDRVYGVELGDSKVVKGKIIVDASGPPATISSLVGLRDHVVQDQGSGVGLEYIMNGVNFPSDNTLSFWLGKKFAPNGYAWVFPMGRKIAKVGVGVIRYPSEDKKEQIKFLLDNFVSKIPWLNSARILDMHGGTLIGSIKIKRYVWGNVVGIGDSMCQVNFLGGEGIRHALRSGRMAAESIDLALKSNDIAKLQIYEKNWKTYVGSKWKQSFYLAKLVYLYSPDWLLDEFLNLSKRITPEGIFNLLFEYQFGEAIKEKLKIISCLPFDIGRSLWTVFKLKIEPV